MMICYNSKSRRISMIEEILKSQAVKDDKNLAATLLKELQDLRASLTAKPIQ